jgi:hypothetical protein
VKIDFSPVNRGDMFLIDFVHQFTLDDLRAMTHHSINTMLEIVAGLDDAQLTFIPDDPDAHDPYATTEEEKHVGWSLAHIVAHVTASSEEGAATSSLLARGVTTSERPRYETPWRDLKTREQVVQRLEESRRIRLAYLDTWPDQPFLDVYRDVSPRFTEKVGLMNAPAAFMFGLKHEIDHHEQMRDVAAQLRAKA